MKKFLHIIYISVLIASLAIPSFAYAESKIKSLSDNAAASFNDGVYWKWSEEDSTLYFTGVGEIFDYGLNDNRPKWCRLSNDVKHIVIDEGITRIGSYAFSYFPNVEDVYIPKSVREIGESAFEKNKSLKTIHFSEGLERIEAGAFCCNDTINEVNLPSTLKYIGDYAFMMTKSLRSIVIPSKVEHIGDVAFSGCDEITFISCIPPDMPYEISERITGIARVPIGSSVNYMDTFLMMSTSDRFDSTVNMSNIKDDSGWQIDEYDNTENLLDEYLKEAKLSISIDSLSFGGVKINCSVDSDTLNKITDTGLDLYYDFYWAFDGSDEYRFLMRSGEPYVKDSEILKGDTFKYKAMIHFEDADGNYTHESELSNCMEQSKTLKHKFLGFIYI